MFFGNKFLNHASTVMGEYISYLIVYIYKVHVYEYEWHEPICTIYNTINKLLVAYFNSDIIRVM